MRRSMCSQTRPTMAYVQPFADCVDENEGPPPSSSRLATGLYYDTERLRSMFMAFDSDGDVQSI